MNSDVYCLKIKEEMIYNVRYSPDRNGCESYAVEGVGELLGILHERLHLQRKNVIFQIISLLTDK